MFESLLVANRGEIARRIMRTARRFGIRTIAVASSADVDARHAREADETVIIGPPPSRDSYLDIAAVIDAARKTGARAIHPGYGFLSENAEFAEAVREAGMTFVGPTPDAIRSMGRKDEAKALAEKAGIPVVPGFFAEAADAKKLAREAVKIGFPVMVKAVAGGGGRGMRAVASEKDLAAAIESAAREAGAAFGDARVMLEKLIVQPRHVEVQIFGDTHGNVVHLFERDCSLQRRHQKVIEEAPAPGMGPKLRAAICNAAVDLARSVAYQGAGTVEFLLPAGDGVQLAEDSPFYFIEMNTRLQVEHPVTEMITGFDLVEWQLRVAAGEPLPRRQDEIHLNGHSIEVRVYAEDPARDFLPSPGKVSRMDIPVPSGGRLEAAMDDRGEVPPYYDAMIAKVISFGRDRESARRDLVSCLSSAHLDGIRHNIGFLVGLLSHGDVAAGRVETGLIDRALKAGQAELSRGEMVAAAVAHMLAQPPVTSRTSATVSPWQRRDAFQLGPARTLPRKILLDGEPHEIVVRWQNGSMAVSFEGAWYRSSGCRVLPAAEGVVVQHGLHVTHVQWSPWDRGQDAGTGLGAGAVRAPITGKVVKVVVQEGDEIRAGEEIAIVEAMKMEHILRAAISGTISELPVTAGTQVSEGDLIALVAATDSDAAGTDGVTEEVA